MLTYSNFLEELQHQENRPIENKPFRYITLDEQVRFCEFIEKVGVFEDKLENIKTCASEYYTFTITLIYFISLSTFYSY